MPTEKNRREASRRSLAAQLELRKEREAVHKKRVMVTSISGSILAVLIIVIIVVVVSTTGGGGSKNPTASSPTSGADVVSPDPSTSASAASPPASPASTAPAAPVPSATGASVSFDGVTVGGAADLKGAPAVTSKSSTPPAKLEFKDLVVGKGAAAGPTSNVTVQYTGVLYSNGTKFDSSWDRGQAAQFSLTGVVPGFTQGIGGTTGVPPMKVGGRRIVIMPSALGYGATAQGSIPANSPLVFVIDLTGVS